MTTRPGCPAMTILSRWAYSHESRSLDTINNPLLASAVQSRPRSNGANFFKSSLGAKVLRPDQKDHPVHEPEGMAQHELLHFLVVGAAPVRPGQERPADLNLTLGFVVAVETRGPD